MTQLLADSTLDRNLARLTGPNAHLARRLGAMCPADVAFEATPQGVPTARYRGRLLASAHRPLDEAKRVASRFDVAEHAVAVALGFGLGYHIRELAKRYDGAGAVIVFEPDLGLLRAVFERIDLDWLERTPVVFLCDSTDRGALAVALKGAESILAQGLSFLDDRANRLRLGAEADTFSQLINEFVATAKTTLMTTLVRAADTVENQLCNLDHYALGEGIVELKDVASGWPAIVVSAGPSLQRNIDQLADEELRRRAVIVAVQTTLKPLLDRGVRPHFVTALDYHEISKRFYEGLTEDDVQGVTLVIDPKAHPIIADSFPGRVRCCRSPFLDKVLGEHARDMGALPAGATVAHLSFYLARWLGCSPITLVGQDLGFTDGLYYTPGTAIHDIWAPELNPFNTIEMMEWQRIARHRVHLHRRADLNGRDIYTDSQMLAYLQQFERDFSEAAEAGVRIIDATEGGVVKQHTEPARLAELTPEFTRPLPPEFTEAVTGGRGPAITSDQLLKRLRTLRRETGRIRTISTETGALLDSMLNAQSDAPKMNRLFAQVERKREQVQDMLGTFETINQLNQIGVFKRHQADRRLQFADSLSPLERQKAQIERDRVNVTWTADAAGEFSRQLDQVIASIACGGDPRPEPTPDRARGDTAGVAASQGTVAALVPYDPAVESVPVLAVQQTLERIAASKRLASIVLIVPRGCSVGTSLDLSTLGARMIVEEVDGSPFGPEHEAVRAARAWSPRAWRGGIAGLTAHDEALCPAIMADVMARHGFEAAIPLRADWSEVDTSDDAGIDGVVARYREHPDRHRLVFTQGPPGIGCCLVNRALMVELAERNRLSTVGGLLIYQPHAPQGDPIARDACVRIPDAIRDADFAAVPEQSEQPYCIVLEATTMRSSRGRLSRSLRAERDGTAMAVATAARALSGLDSERPFVVSFEGRGDPVLHERLHDLVNLAKDHGARSIHVRTELRCSEEDIRELLELPIDILSIDIHADRAETYRRMMGDDGLERVVRNIDFVVHQRRLLTEHPPTAAWGIPWIVPRIVRCTDTIDDIDTFFDRWQRALGTALIEAEPITAASSPPDDTLLPTWPPNRVTWRQLMSRLVIAADGTIPVCEFECGGSRNVGHIDDESLSVLWSRLLNERRRIRDTEGPDSPSLKTAWP